MTNLRNGMMDTMLRIFGYGAIRNYIRSQKPNYAARSRTSIATENRWGGPHEHKREIARRQRQAANRG